MSDNSRVEDLQLVQAAQAGTLEGFTALYERYLPLAYKRVRYLVPEADVEDVTQEIFIAVMRSLHGFRGDALFSTWLRTIIQRQIAEYYRRRGPLPVDMERDDQEDEVESQEFVADDRLPSLDDCMVVRQALQRLPEKYTEILLLRFADGLQFNEIANLHYQSLEATKSLFRRAIAALEKQLEETYA